MKISVIVPVYNVEKYLSECLENIIYQTYKNLEIIVVNDGSTDNSLSICKDYAKKDKRIRLITQKNKGLSGARNVGMKYATGDYIHFIDSDDYISLDFYEKMIKSLDNTNADIVLGGFYFERHPNESVKFNNRFIYTNLDDKIEKTFVCKYKYVWRYLIKTSFVKKQKLSFMEGLYMEDIMFTVPAFTMANKVVTVPDIQYFYRNNGNSILNWKNRKKNKKLKKNFSYVMNLLKQYAKEHNLKLSCPVISTTLYKFLGMFPIIKKYVYVNKVIYKLFGIVIWEKR